MNSKSKLDSVEFEVTLTPEPCRATTKANEAPGDKLDRSRTVLINQEISLLVICFSWIVYEGLRQGPGRHQ